MPVGCEDVLGRRNPWVKAPVVPGHEFFGHVDELGRRRRRALRRGNGRRVIAEQIVPCERCRYCRRASTGCARSTTSSASSARSPRAAWRSSCASRRPRSCTGSRRKWRWKTQRIIEPLACAIHAVNRGDIQLDDVVVIAGAGPIGLMMVQVAKLKTPRKLVVIDMVAQRLRARAAYGADVVIDPKTRTRCDRARPHRRLWLRRVHRGDRLASGAVQGLDLIRKLGRFVEFRCSATTRGSTGRSSAIARSSTSAARTSALLLPDRDRPARIAAS